jgi:hypothetical protein
MAQELSDYIFRRFNRTIPYKRYGGGGPMSRDLKFMIVLTICLVWIAIVGYIAGVPW